MVEPRRGHGWRAGASLPTVALSMMLGMVLALLLLVLLGRGLLSLLWPAPTIALPSLPTLAPLTLPTPAPTPTPKIITSGEVVRQIQQLNRLESSAYSVQTVVTVERPGNLIGVGRQRLLVVVQGTVVAGIDLGRLRGQDVTVTADGRRLRVRLPEAEIFSTALDEQRTEIYDFQTGLFTRPDMSLVVEAQRAGAAQILQTACRDGILQHASDNSQRSIRQLLGLAGFEQIEIEETPSPVCSQPAPTASPRRP